MIEGLPESLRYDRAGGRLRRVIKLLRTELDDEAFRVLLPKVQALAGAPRPGIVGSAAEREAGETVKGRRGESPN